MVEVRWSRKPGCGKGGPGWSFVNRVDCMSLKVWDHGHMNSRRRLVVPLVVFAAGCGGVEVEWGSLPKRVRRRSCLPSSSTTCCGSLEVEQSRRL